MQTPPVPVVRLRLVRLAPLLLAPVLVMLLIGVISLWSAPAQATVTARPVEQATITARYYISPTGNDTNDCSFIFLACRSLQRAVESAMKQKQVGVEIRIAKGIYSGVSLTMTTQQLAYLPISMTISGGFDPENFNGSPQPQAFPVILDAETQGRVLFITNGADVTVQNLTLRNGDGLKAGDAGDGGAVRVVTATARFNNVTFTNHGGRNGGALAVDRAQVTLTNVVFNTSQAAESGGVIYITGITSTVGIGGANSFNDSRAGKAGGVVAVSGGRVELNNPVLNNYRADDGRGSLLFANNATAIIRGVTLSNNSGSGDGSLIHMTGGRLDLLGGALRNNSTTGNGILYVTGGSLLLDGVIASGNRAHKGGLLWADQSQITIRNSPIDSHAAQQSDGGALFVARGAITIEKSSLLNNSALRHGGALYAITSTVTLSDTPLSENRASGNGGAIFALASPLTLTNVPISKNSGVVDGGALYLERSPTTVSGGTLSENGATGRGGAIFALASPLILTNVPISKNSGVVDGGALYLERSPTTVSGGTLSENGATGAAAQFLR